MNLKCTKADLILNFLSNHFCVMLMWIRFHTKIEKDLFSSDLLLLAHIYIDVKCGLIVKKFIVLNFNMDTLPNFYHQIYVNFVSWNWVQFSRIWILIQKLNFLISTACMFSSCLIRTRRLLWPIVLPRYNRMPARFAVC